MKNIAILRKKDSNFAHRKSDLSEDFKRSEMEKIKKVGELQGFDYDDICEVIEVLEKQGFVVTDNDLSETNWNSYNILKKNK